MTKYQEFLNGAYQEFLNRVEIIPEDLFNDIVNNLPEIEISNIDFTNLYEFNSQDNISELIINEILRDWNYCNCYNVDFENKTFELEDVDSLEDLEKIKNIFNKWTISNYDTIKEELE